MKHRKKIWLMILLSGIVYLSFQINPPDDIRINKIIRQLEIFTTKYKQQKVYLHTDKDIYFAGENIWLKSYLLEASTFLPDSMSKELYVDLIDFSNKHVQSIILRNINGFGSGNIHLQDTLAEGNYQIRGYTNWMRNFDESFFYYKTIKILNPNYENIITNKRLTEIKRFNRNIKRLQNDFTFSLFPEGGDLIYGFKSNVAFKAENYFGEGINVSGSVYSDKNGKILDFQSVHNGMGIFSFTPEKGEKYHVKINYNNSKNDKVDLPEILEKGVSIVIDPFLPDNIRMIVRSNRSISDNIASDEVIITGQSRGEILYMSKGEVRDQPLDITIPKKIFPSGIIQFTVFDARSEPVCERLVFIGIEKEINLNSLKVNKKVSADSSTFIIQVNKNDGAPSSANLSFALMEKTPGVNDLPNSNILSDLLFTSDIKGKIENPWFYFSGDTNAEKYLDLVMLTHGWRRFAWKEILNNNFPEILNPPSLGISIGGKITRDFFDIPVPNSKVRLTILSSYNDVFETTTDRRGRFLFSNLDYEDTIDIKIEAFKPSGGKGVLIQIGDTIVPDIVTVTNPEFRNEVFTKDKIKANNRRERIEFKRNYKGRPEPDNQMFKIHNTPNDVIYVGEEVSNYSNILDYMQGRIPGVNITGNRVIIRGINTFYGSTDPLFLLDGIPIDAGSVTSINPLDIAIIEVLKGPEAAIYGSRGANGVIAFYTRRGEFMKRGVIDFGMLGYQKVREFYTPAYEKWYYKPQDYHVPRTIYWKPDVIISPSGITTFKFRNNIKSEKKVLQIEGITGTGEIIYYRENLD